MECDPLSNAAVLTRLQFVYPVDQTHRRSDRIAASSHGHWPIRQYYRTKGSSDSGHVYTSLPPTNPTPVPELTSEVFIPYTVMFVDYLQHGTKLISLCLDYKGFNRAERLNVVLSIILLVTWANITRAIHTEITTAHSLNFLKSESHTKPS